MFSIGEIKFENTNGICVTDNLSPVVSFALESDLADCKLKNATVRIANTVKTVTEQTGIKFETLNLKPFTKYSVEIVATDNFGRTASKSVDFETGRLNTPWSGKWITDNSYSFPKGQSPKPMTFLRKFICQKEIKRAYITATAIGIYELKLNGEKVGNQYFAPGFTSYKHTLQYQYYDITDMLKSSNELIAVVGGGWAVGRFTYKSKSKITADRQAFLAEIFIEYEGGGLEKIVTDTSWKVTLDGNYRFGDFYDGETYDATVDLKKVHCKVADVCRIKIKPQIIVNYGAPVVAHETIMPKDGFPAPNGEYIYDFGQNFAGIVLLKINGTHGQKITVRHAEILLNDNLCTKSLRTAKATATYICKDGEQVYSPCLTYMGFRYIGISGISPEDITVKAIALYSDFEQTGTFECSNALLNQLQRNIVWSGKSNFVDIPTDCPQRDERMGWTGDMSVYSHTACYLFDLSRFLQKWLNDVSLEQGRRGGIPLVVPKQGISAPTVATACWGDCCILVPWSEYLARGNVQVLESSYPTMLRFLKAVKFWAGLSGAGRNKKHIWKWLFQFGDWCAPEGGVRDWMKRGKWIATAYYANSCKIVSQIARILGKDKDAEKFGKLYGEISAAYRKVFTDGKGKLKQEFQTGYVLPLCFGIVEGEERKEMASNLNRLVKENGYRLNTGFTGTPFILFALADNGYIDTAYKVLLQENSPSWLYCVKNGATTTWEEWTIDPKKNGNIPSYNHYAYGAVGDFLYRRVLGIETIDDGYKKFRIQPVIGGNLTYAKGSLKTPYGTIYGEWEIKNNEFILTAEVPVSCKCDIVMPSGKKQIATSGTHSFSEKFPA